MEDKIFVVGHKNPDTDSICAALGLIGKERLPLNLRGDFLRISEESD